jgi:NAD-dependent deacetylase
LKNVDDLHEPADSHRIHQCMEHSFSRSTRQPPPFPDVGTAESRSAHTFVWFGEVPLDMKGIDREINNATVVLAVDTSGSVYPAAGFVYTANHGVIAQFYVGPEAPMDADAFDEIVEAAATEVLPQFLRVHPPRNARNPRHGRNNRLVRPIGFPELQRFGLDVRLHAGNDAGRP